MRFIAVFYFKVSSLIQQEMALMLQSYIFWQLKPDLAYQWSIFPWNFVSVLILKKNTYHQGELQSTFIEFSHDF